MYIFKLLYTFEIEPGPIIQFGRLFSSHSDFLKKNIVNVATMVASGEHLYDLPEDCISTIICFTSPPDALKLSLISSIFRSVAELDCVWDAFLPSDWQHIATKSVTPLKFSSKRHLFFCLCNSILIDGGNKVTLKNHILLVYKT